MFSEASGFVDVDDALTFDELCGGIGRAGNGRRLARRFVRVNEDESACEGRAAGLPKAKMVPNG